MSRILAVFSGYGQGQTSGAERMAWQTTAALARRGHEVAVLTDSPLPPGLSGNHWPVFRSVRAASADLARFRPDIVHAYDLARLDGVELAVDMASRWNARFALTPASTAEVWPDLGVGAALCAKAEALYTLTRAEALALEGMGVPTSRLWVLPQAPDLVGVADPAAFRTEHRISGRLVLFLGRRIASKGYQTLLEAAPMVWKDLPDTDFAFVGPIGDRAAAHAFDGPLDPRIRDLGTLPEQEKHSALAACSVLCVPTVADVFPLVFAEAWACGKPVVTSRFTGAEEVVRHGVDGIVTEARPADVATALLRLLPDRAALCALGEAGRRRVAVGMSWERVAETVEDSYRSLLAPTLDNDGGSDR